jgi:hypothetical protein
LHFHHKYPDFKTAKPVSSDRIANHESIIQKTLSGCIHQPERVNLRHLGEMGWGSVNESLAQCQGDSFCALPSSIVAMSVAIFVCPVKALPSRSSKSPNSVPVNVIGSNLARFHQAGRRAGYFVLRIPLSLLLADWSQSGLFFV